MGEPPVDLCHLPELGTAVAICAVHISGHFVLHYRCSTGEVIQLEVRPVRWRVPPPPPIPVPRPGMLPRGPSSASRSGAAIQGVFAAADPPAGAIHPAAAAPVFTAAAAAAGATGRRSNRSRSRSCGHAGGRGGSGSSSSGMAAASGSVAAAASSSGVAATSSSAAGGLTAGTSGSGAKSQARPLPRNR